jgi:hypothetical protein
MKEFLKKSGLILIIAGIGMLAYTEFSKMENNSMLIFSGALIVFGLLAYVVLNNIID